LTVCERIAGFFRPLGFHGFLNRDSACLQRDWTNTPLKFIKKWAKILQIRLAKKLTYNARIRVLNALIISKQAVLLNDYRKVAV